MSSPSETNNFFPNQIERAEKLLRDVVSDMNSWHNHKENLAHASIAVMGGVVGGILVTETWPPEWVNFYFSSPDCVTLVVFTILWALIHVYMRWQLRQRRSAAIMHNSANRILSEWIGRTPTTRDFELEPEPPSRINKLFKFLDLVFVVQKGVLVEDNAKYYPKWLMAKYEQVRNEMPGIFAEWILTLASFALSALVWFRTAAN